MFQQLCSLIVSVIAVAFTLSIKCQKPEWSQDADTSRKLTSERFGGEIRMWQSFNTSASSIPSSQQFYGNWMSLIHEHTVGTAGKPSNPHPPPPEWHITLSSQFPVKPSITLTPPLSAGLHSLEEYDSFKTPWQSGWSDNWPTWYLVKN